MLESCVLLSQFPQDLHMGVKNDDGSACCVIGVLKAIRHCLTKGDGDAVHAVITAAGGEKP